MNDVEWLVFLANFHELAASDFEDELRHCIRDRAVRLNFRPIDVDFEEMTADEMLAEGLDTVIKFLCDESESGLTTGQVREMIRYKSRSNPAA